MVNMAALMGPKISSTLTDLGLVLEEDWSVEIGDLLVRELADGLALAGVRKDADLDHLLGRALGLAMEAPAAATAAAERHRRHSLADQRTADLLKQIGTS